MPQQALSIRIASRHRHRSHTGIVLALRDEIQSALNDGWSRHSIWETLFEEGRVTIRYHAFLRNLLKAGILGPQHPDVAGPSPTGTSASPGGFLFGGQPNKKDLT